MAHARVKEVIAEKANYYLITNRVAAGRMLLKNPEKQKLKDLLFAGTSKFCYSVIDYVFMDNHFHLVIKVNPSSECSDEELLKRYRIYKKNEEVDFVSKAQREEFRYKAHDISFIIGNFEQGNGHGFKAGAQLHQSVVGSLSCEFVWRSFEGQSSELCYFGGRFLVKSRQCIDAGSNGSATKCELVDKGKRIFDMLNPVVEHFRVAGELLS